MTVRVGLFKFSDFSPGLGSEDYEYPFRYIGTWTLDGGVVDLANTLVSALSDFDTGNGGDAPEASLETIYRVATGGYANPGETKTMLWFADTWSVMPFDDPVPAWGSLISVNSREGPFQLNTAWLSAGNVAYSPQTMATYRYGRRFGTYEWYLGLDEAVAPGTAASFPETVAALVNGGWYFMSFDGSYGETRYRASDLDGFVPFSTAGENPQHFASVMCRVTGTYRIGGTYADEFAVWERDTVYADYPRGLGSYTPADVTQMRDTYQTYGGGSGDDQFIAVLVDGTGSFNGGADAEQTLHEVLVTIIGAASGGSGWGVPIAATSGGDVSGRYIKYPGYQDTGGYFTVLSAVSSLPPGQTLVTATHTPDDDGYVYLRVETSWSAANPAFHECYFGWWLWGTDPHPDEDILTNVGIDVRLMGYTGGSGLTVTVSLTNLDRTQYYGQWAIPITYGDPDTDPWPQYLLVKNADGPNEISVAGYNRAGAWSAYASGYLGITVEVSGGTNSGAITDGIAVGYLATFSDYLGTGAAGGGSGGAPYVPPVYVPPTVPPGDPPGPGARWAGHVPDRVLFGMCVQSGSNPVLGYDEAVGYVGEPYVRRSFGNGNWISASAINTWLSTCTAKNQYPWISFKVPGNDWAGVIAGDYDNDLDIILERAVARSEKWTFTVHHEPSGDGDLSVWAGMQQYISNYVASVSNKVCYTPIINGFFWGPKGVDTTRINQSVPTSLINTLNNNDHVLAADCYDSADPSQLSYTQYNRTSLKMTAFFDWCRSHGVNSVGIGEFGCHDGEDMRRCWNVLANNSDMVGIAVYYNSGINSRANWLLVPDEFDRTGTDRDGTPDTEAKMEYYKTALVRSASVNPTTIA